MATMITKPVFWVIMLSMWALVFPLITGAYNGIYLNTVDGGVINNAERFDRIMPKDTYGDAEEAWRARTATVDHGGTAAALSNTSVYIVGGNSGGCAITATTTAGAEFYTPSGNIITVTDDAGTIANCSWESASPIFGVFNGFVRIILQVVALAAPLGFMLALSYFGAMMMNAAGGHPIMRVIMVVITVLIGAILVNIVLPYISGVWYAIDRDRFIVFDQELGLIAGLLKNFFGVIFAAGIIGSAWGIVNHIRDGAGGGGSARLGTSGAGGM